MYATLSSTSLIAPVNPGADPTKPRIASGLQITNLRYAHEFATNVFNEYDRIDKALCQMLIAAVDKMFIRYLHHRYVGYGTTTTRTFLDHLYATTDLQDNNT